jgi:hypothetical protein
LHVIRSSGDVLVDHDPTQPLGVATKQYADSVAPLAQSDTVFQVATTGNDTTDYGSLAAPFATIQHALVEASRYDYQGLYNVHINIENGTYVENVSLPDFRVRNNNTDSATPNWYNGGVNIIADTASTGATAPLVIIDGGGGVCFTNTTCQLYITGIRFKAVGQWSQGIWSNRTIRIGHLGWSVEGTCLPHCGGSFQSAANENMVFVNNSLYIWGFFQSWADVWNIPFDFPATGLAIGHCFIYAAATWTYVSYGNCPITNGNMVTGRRVDIDGFGMLYTVDGTTNGVPGDGNPPDIRGTGSFNSTIGPDAGIPSEILRQISNLPSTTSIPLDCWNITKDAAGGGIYIAANDGDVVKKL